MSPPAHYLGDGFRCCVHILVFPYTNAQPSDFRQTFVCPAITGHVGRELRDPPGVVPYGNSRMNRARVPKKQPSTNTATFAPMNAISQRRRDIPGNGSSIRYPRPSFRSCRRRLTSGAVFLAFWSDIRLDVERSVFGLGTIIFGPAIVSAVYFVERLHS